MQGLSARFGGGGSGAGGGGGGGNSGEGGTARCVLVYLAEAHASDEWPVGDPVAVPQPLTLLARASHAARFVRFMAPCLDGWDLAIDDPEGAPEGAPERGGAHGAGKQAEEDLEEKEEAGGGVGDGAGAFDTAYAAWPTRFYVLDGRGGGGGGATLAFKAEPDADHEYTVAALEAFLAKEATAAAAAEATPAPEGARNI
jgi:hypothetical protein